MPSPDPLHDRLVQYIVIRSDLAQGLGWPLGAVIAQACHAATAAIHLTLGDNDTKQYLADLDNMHKVILQGPDEASLLSLAETLAERGIAHKIWFEQPENVPTCLALRPCCKETVRPLLRDFNLFK